MDDSLRNEYNDWYNQYYYQSVGIKKKETDPEYDEDTYTDKLLSPVADILGKALQSITLQDVIDVLKYVKETKFHFFWRVADLVAKYSISIPPDLRRDKISKPFDDFLKAHTACYIMTKGGDPVIGYAKKRGDLVGVDPDKFARLGAVSKIRNSLTNLKVVLATEPSKMSDMNRRMVREMGRVGIITNRNLASEVLPIPDKKGGVKDTKVTVLSDCLPSYAVCTLIACLPEALRNEYPNPYKAALEYAKTSSDPKYSSLVPELQVLAGESSTSSSSETMDIDAYLKSIGYDDSTIVAIKNKDVVSGTILDKVLQDSGIKFSDIQSMVRGELSQGDMHAATIAGILNIDKDTAVNLITEGIAKPADKDVQCKALSTALNVDVADVNKLVDIGKRIVEGNYTDADTTEFYNVLSNYYSKDFTKLSEEEQLRNVQAYVSSHRNVIERKLASTLSISPENAELALNSIGSILLNDVTKDAVDKVCNSLGYQNLDITGVVTKTLSTFGVTDPDYIDAALSCMSGELATGLRLYTDEGMGKSEVVTAPTPIERVDSAQRNSRLQAAFRENAQRAGRICDIVIQVVNGVADPDVVDKVDEIVTDWYDTLGIRNVEERQEVNDPQAREIADDVLSFFGITGSHFADDYIHWRGSGEKSTMRLYTQSELDKRIGEVKNAANVRSSDNGTPTLEQMTGIVIGALEIFGVTDNQYAQEYIKYVQADTKPTLRLYTQSQELSEDDLYKILSSHLATVGVRDDSLVEQMTYCVKTGTDTDRRLYEDDIIAKLIKNVGLNMSVQEAIMSSNSRELRQDIIDDYLKNMGITELTKDGGIKWTEEMSPSQRVSQGVSMGLENDKAYKMAERLLLFIRSNILSGSDPQFRAKAVALQRILLPSFFAAPDGLGTVTLLCDGIMDEVEDEQIKGVVRECKQIAQS